MRGASSNAGVSDAELDELPFQIAGYCGAPAALAARRAIAEVRASRRGAAVSVIGVIGLGNMGSVLAANLVASGAVVVVHDRAGVERSVEGAHWVCLVRRRRSCGGCRRPQPPRRPQRQPRSSPRVGRGPILEIAPSIDTSTIGPHAARSNAEPTRPEPASAYVDAPVSGGPAGARARTLAVMYSGSDVDCDAPSRCWRRSAIGLAASVTVVGLGQAAKLANNFLSATALAATSEAVAFGVSAGLDMSELLEVLNGASGGNTATSDKFPNHVVTGRYASGFSNTLMAKDIELYLAEVSRSGGATTIGEVTARSGPVRRRRARGRFHPHLPVRQRSADGARTALAGEMMICRIGERDSLRWERGARTGLAPDITPEANMTIDVDAVDFFRDNELLASPTSTSTRCGRECPVRREPHHGVVMITGYDEAIAVYNDTERFSSCVAVTGPFPGFPVPLEGDDVSELIAQHRDSLPMSDQLPTMDPPMHTDHRSLLMRLITPKRLKENEEFMCAAGRPPARHVPRRRAHRSSGSPASRPRSPCSSWPTCSACPRPITLVRAGAARRAHRNDRWHRRRTAPPLAAGVPLPAVHRLRGGSAGRPRPATC